jgi:formyltetrahydrofolate deformylase
MTPSKLILSEITVIGPDRKGVVAGVTNYIFNSQGNIEKISQNVIRGLFGMHLEASFQKSAFKRGKFLDGIAELGRKLGMEIKVHLDEPNRFKNMAILVTREPHCLEAILEAKRKKELRVNIKAIIGTEPALQNIAIRHGIPFFVVDHKDQDTAEAELLKITEQMDVDFIALARYMRILSPNFVWRFPNRIINIHPSLLPAFSGAYAYLQAYERGAQIVGCTAHFVTEDLDQGPIIHQESFRVTAKDDLGSIKKRGQALEARTLLNAVKLYLENKLEVYWGRVHFKKGR